MTKIRQFTLSQVMGIANNLVKIIKDKYPNKNFISFDDCLYYNNGNITLFEDGQPLNDNVYITYFEAIALLSLHNSGLLNKIVGGLYE